MSLMVPFLLWLWSRDRSATAPTPPHWPTAASPPPPIKAFQSQVPPAAPKKSATPTADTGTPLATLNKSPPTPAPAHKSTPPTATPAAAAAHPATTHQPTPATVKAAVRRAAASATAAPQPSAALRTADVLSLQTIVNTRGGKLKRDGLYGPKTASAWTALAKAKGLPGTISRVGPKSARVVSHTYDALSVPPIP